MGISTMEAFREYIVATAHVAERHAPFYVGWVRQAYELAGAEAGTPLPPASPAYAVLKGRHRTLSITDGAPRRSIWYS
jgi:hypothetical protein